MFPPPFSLPQIYCVDLIALTFCDAPPVEDLQMFLGHFDMLI
jgi:hypothetical protein